MIEVTRLNGTPYFLNSDLIVTIEATPDTIITLNNGEKLMVREKVQDIIANVVDFKRKLYNPDFAPKPER